MLNRTRTVGRRISPSAEPASLSSMYLLDEPLSPFRRGRHRKRKVPWCNDVFNHANHRPPGNFILTISHFIRTFPLSRGAPARVAQFAAVSSSALDKNIFSTGDAFERL